MTQLPTGPGSLGRPPYSTLRRRLSEELDALRARGQSEAARGLERALDEWWSEQSAWDSRLVELLRVHHDINNALVGVSGNAQLMMRDPIAQKPGVRERLEVMLREAGRIQTAAGRLRELKTALQGGSSESRAA